MYISCISQDGYGYLDEAIDGITIGSEMIGWIEDVKLWDCDLMNSFNGIEIAGQYFDTHGDRRFHVFDVLGYKVRITGLPAHI